MLRLCDVTPSDAERIYEWRNLPEIIALGASGKPVTPEEHAAWIEWTLAHPDERRVWIPEPAQGVVRIDRNPGEPGASIGIYLLPEWRGRGYGVEAIKQATQAAFDLWSVTDVFAEILPGNSASVRAFAKAGYKLLTEDRGGIVMRRKNHEGRGPSELPETPARNDIG